MNFFKVLSSCNYDKKNIAFTVINGEGYGEKAIFSEGIPVFTSKHDGFLSSNSDELSKFSDTGIFTLKNSLIYVENIGLEKKIIICGAGHVSMPIIRLSKTLGFNVTVIDDREIFAENARNAGADIVICENFSNALSKISSGSNTYFVIVTRGHAYDFECLKIILKKSRAYIGMMGSGRRVKIVRERLISEGYNYDDIMKIHAPIGLSINAETPEEIAVSIMAEIIQVKNQSRDIEFPAEILSYIIKNESVKKVLCTTISKKGAAPREVGTKMLCTNEVNIGTIGGGLMEAKVIQKAEEIFSGKISAPVLMRVELNANEASKEGEVCGGVIEIWIECA